MKTTETLPQNLIFETKDYTIFKYLPGNRPVIRSHVESLKKSLSIKNLLQYKQIIVDDQMRVYDGQHRLAAAKELKMPVFYQIGLDLKPEDVGIFNACSDDWELRHYLEFYIEQNNGEYQKVKRFLEENNLTLTRFKLIISPLQKKVFDDKFKTGEFVCVDDLNIYSMILLKMGEVIHFLNEIIISDNKHFLKTDAFWKALNLFYSNKDIDHDKFKEKLSYKFQSIRQMSGYKDYLNAFTQIYNWKSKQKI